MNEFDKWRERYDTMTIDEQVAYHNEIEARYPEQKHYNYDNVKEALMLCDKPIVLELEHIDGNHSNNERENLEAICPNCHSQTDTWRGRNKTNKRLKISDDEIVKAYIKTNSIRQTLLEVGLAAKGGNYKRVHGIVRKYEL